jgi:hypothetical protein
MLVFVFPTPVLAAELPLTVDWGGVTLDRAFPVTGGIPLARGALTDVSQARLLCAGEEVPLQTEVLAWWPDKSIKWLLLDFQATPTQTAFTLQYGAGTRRQSVRRGITITRSTDGATTVDAGPTSFAVSASGGGFIEEVSYNGNRMREAAGRRMNLLDFLHTESPGDYHPGERYLRNATQDPSQVLVSRIVLEKAGPLHAVVLIEGRYTYKLVGSTITGTNVKGDCPFRLRIHAYAGWALLKVEHFFCYEGDGDHDFARALGLRVPLPQGATAVSCLADPPIPRGPFARETGPRHEERISASGLYQASPDHFAIWTSDGRSLAKTHTGRRFEGVLDVRSPSVSLALGVRDFWQNAAKGLQADLEAGEATVYLWPPEAPPLDFRRHAREWSVGETGEPDDKDARTPAPFQRDNYRLASKGVGKTHYVMLYLHPPGEKPEDTLAVYRLFHHRPLLWAPASHYAQTLVFGRYRERVPGEHDDVEEALDRPIRFLRFSQDHFRWYGFWLFGNVCQEYNSMFQNGRWTRDFGRWGWANGDSVGRLAYALMLQAVRKCTRTDLQFAEDFMLNIHDVASTHTPAYPEHYTGNFLYLKGAAHRHGAWPWACPYTGIRGAHPVGAKIHYFLTGEGHTKDILDEITQLVLRNPNGGEGDGPLGPNAQIYLYQWEVTGDDQWRQKLKTELETSDGLRNATGGWLVMMNAAFGIQNALDEYMDLSGETSMRALAASYADRCMPKEMKNHWTWGGYYRVYASAFNYSGEEKYREAIKEMLELLVSRSNESLPFRLPEAQWPGPPGGPRPFFDANIIRDVPFALYSLHNDVAKGGG